MAYANELWSALFRQNLSLQNFKFRCCQPPAGRLLCPLMAKRCENLLGCFFLNGVDATRAGGTVPSTVDGRQILWPKAEVIGLLTALARTKSCLTKLVMKCLFALTPEATNER
ncbi:hypothetical protein GPALN_002994 [Globodera pallida]|nr:hypothetical protein GPALN_002994 [Globodera pallida]